MSLPSDPGRPRRARGRFADIAALLRPHVREEDLGRAAIALSLALLTVLAAIVAGLQSHASTMAQQGRREADRIGLAATGNDGSAVLRVGNAYGVYRRWFEEVERSLWAQDQLARDPDRPDRAQLETLAEVDDAIAAWALQQSALMQAPYFDAVAGRGDFGAFEADLLYGPARRAAEQREIEAEVAAGWDAKASDYITVLTVLAVGLFFLGLGSTVGRRARRFLSSAGIAFGVAAAGWTLAIALVPIHRVPEEAVERVVESVAHQFRAGGAQGAEVTPESRAQFEAAIARASEALAIDATYRNAVHTRADARLLFADTLIFSPEGQSATTNELLRAAIEDYRHYLAQRPDDYSAWWNLGWAAYLQGDAVGALEATNRAIALAPTQFTLYLNRTLALLATRDEAAALADVRSAIALAGRDASDSVAWYLGQSDFNLGRLAEIRIDQAPTLRAIQQALREARVALRVRGEPVPLAGAPELGSVTVRPIEIGRYGGGAATELPPLTAGQSIEAPSAVGFRVTVAGTAELAGRTLSARLWVGDQLRSDLLVDLALGAAPTAETTLDLVNPYGRAGFDLDPGEYQLQLFVDGATRFEMTWLVTPRPTQPGYTMAATPLLERLRADGFSCDEPTVGDGATVTTCGAGESDAAYQATVTADAQDRITALVLRAETGSTEVDVGERSRLFFGYVLRLLYPADAAARAEAWLADQGTVVNDVEIAGTTIRVFGATDTARNLDIWSPWP